MSNYEDLELQQQRDHQSETYTDSQSATRSTWPLSTSPKIDHCSQTEMESTNKTWPAPAPLGISAPTPEEQTPLKRRERWSNPLEFLLSCIAMSVGLGNVWRFPFTAYENGGGVFLFPYLIVLVLIGRPYYFMELVLGQFTSKSAVKIWNMVPALRGVGYGQIVACSSILSYYTFLIALAIHYLISSFTTELPWMSCHPELERPNTLCVDQTNQGVEAGANITLMSSAEQYFTHGVLNQKLDISEGLGDPSLKLTLCLLLCWTLVFLVLWKGVASSGKVAYFTALFPYVVLVALLVRGVTLPGAVEGLRFYLTPNWSALLRVRVWYEAVVQSFFSLSVGVGALINYASYNDFRHNVYRDALIISFVDTFTSFLAGLVIFSILGYLAHELNVPITKVIQDGTGLAFVSYPTALGKVKYAPQVFSILFFLMLITLGIGTSTGLMSGIIAVVHDDFPHLSKTRITAALCFTGLLLSVVYVTPGGQQMLNLVDFFGGGFIVFALATLEVGALHWCYGTKRFVRDIKFMISTDLGIYWKFSWFILSPVALLSIFLYSLATMEPLQFNGRPYPEYALYVGYLLIGVACVQVPIWIAVAAFFQPGTTCLEKFGHIWEPNDEWGPADSKLRLEWIRAEADHYISNTLN